MNDFRISVFLSVSRHLNFTKAAEELSISQPAISKHINELERRYGVQLLERTKSRVRLTVAGEEFLRIAKQIDAQYKELEFEMNQQCNRQGGVLSVGASTTIAQYLLPSIISKFKSSYPDVRISLVAGNTEAVERMIEQGSIDIGLVEGAVQRKDFHYTLFAHDELVLVCSAQRCAYQGDLVDDEVSVEQLMQLPLVLRENGSGTLEVIKGVLAGHGVRLADLNVVMQLGGSEAIKRYVLEGGSCAIVSIAAVADELKRGELRVVDISDVSFERDFSFIEQVGGRNRLAQLFAQFSTSITNGYRR